MVKKLSPLQRTQFWADFDAGKKDYKEVVSGNRTGVRKKPRPIIFDLTRARSMRPVAVTPTVAGTVRGFGDYARFRRFIEKVRAVNKLVPQKNTFFDFVPMQILAIDRKNLRILERVYPAPSINDIRASLPERKAIKKGLVYEGQSLVPYSRYDQFFQRKVDAYKKPVDWNKVDLAIEKAYEELVREITLGRKILIDFDPTNILVIDFDFARMRPTLCLVDHGGSFPTR
ncbi:MAG: hypothetical protein WCW13_03085 [archaeon]|jgi:hypothetical protein